MTATSIIEIVLEDGNIDVVLKTTRWGGSLHDDGYDYGRVKRNALPELIETIINDIENVPGHPWDGTKKER